MRTLTGLAAMLIVMALAFWAYRENYRTQAVLDDMQKVQREIAGLRERLGMLNAEWAYLNRPERLAQLLDINAERLNLVPLAPGQLLVPQQIAYARPLVTPALPPSPLGPTLSFDAPGDGARDDADKSSATRPADAPRPRPAHLSMSMP